MHGLRSNTNILNPILGSETTDMTSDGLGEMCEGDSADARAGKCPLMSMGGRAKRLAWQSREQGPPSESAEMY